MHFINKLLNNNRLLFKGFKTFMTKNFLVFSSINLKYIYKFMQNNILLLFKILKKSDLNTTICYKLLSKVYLQRYTRTLMLKMNFLYACVKRTLTCPLSHTCTQFK